MDADVLARESRRFLEWAVTWYNGRQALDLEQVVRAAGGSDGVAVMAVDVTHGFCVEGALASGRVGAIAAPAASLFERAYAHGVVHYVLPQDTHSQDAAEFSSFPPHCVRGSKESETVPELRELPFSHLFRVIEKDTVSSSIGTELDRWLENHPGVNTFLIAGDCTDLCVYHLAMHLRLRANALGQQGVRVIVPLDSVATFDLPVQVADEMGAMPHHGDLFHLLFLFSMAQNGVEVVGRLV